MRSANGKTRLSARIYKTKPRKNAASIRRDQADGSLIVTIGDTDLPAFVSSGILYVQAPLPHIFRAFAEDLSDFLGDMEVRVSDARGATLPFDSDGRPIYRAGMAISGLVSDSGEQG